MDNFLAGDSSLMDGTSDLPQLPLLLLPLCSASGPVAAPSPTAAASPSVSMPTDMYSWLHRLRGTFLWC